MESPITSVSAAGSPPLEGSYEEYLAAVAVHRRWQSLSNRAHRDDPGVYRPEINERVKVARVPGATFVFRGYGSDEGGDYAIVLGGLSGHRIERCVTVDRIRPLRSVRRKRSTATAE